MNGDCMDCTNHEIYTDEIDGLIEEYCVCEKGHCEQHQVNCSQIKRGELKGCQYYQDFTTNQ